MSGSQEERDEILEEIARRIEERSLLDLRGMLAKRKRAREDADLRMKAREEQRVELADLVRSMKSSRGRDSLTILADLASIPDGHRHDIHLNDAWPLAWRGWVTIDCILRCNSNSVPPHTEFRIELTDEGRAALRARTGSAET